VLVIAGSILGYIAVVAARRSEGVFVPAGYVALVCLAAGVFLARVAWRG
jgi:hypothetical protein